MTATTEDQQSVHPPAARTKKKDPALSLKLWHGMLLGRYLQLLVHNRFAVSLRRIHRATIFLFSSSFNSCFRLVDSLVYGRRVAKVELKHPPLFIIGHWRTGTTLLHEILVRDERFNYPNTYRCLAPTHFLLTETFLPPLIEFLLPDQRPMDNMPVGFQRPQEDEFALCNQNIPSPYLFWMFSHRECPFDNYLDLSGLTNKQLSNWKAALARFMKRITYRDSRRLVLKSPTHTARVQALLELFPDAQFIHLSRDPQVMIPSTIHTWNRLSQTMGLRVDHRADMDDYVLDTFTRLDRAFQSQRDLIPPEQFFELRYEDLVADMPAAVREIYDHLDLGDYENIRPHLEAFLSENKGYRTNRFSEDAELRQKIDQTCREYRERYGYE